MLFNFIGQYLKKFYTWLLPYNCLLCGQISTRSQDLCEPCFKTLPTLIHFCKRCANPLSITQSNLLCAKCIEQSPAFDSAHALFIYQAPIVKLILNLKFNSAILNAEVLGELLAHKIQSEWYLNKPLPEIIIPVPLHPNRLHERGFNQALEIARPVAKKLKLQINLTSCHRIKHTTAQAKLAADDRKKNLRDAFCVTANLTGKHVAILDDVITTGHTVSALTMALRQSGASRIDVWCIARPAL